MIGICNSFGLIEFILSVSFELLVYIEWTCQVHLSLLPIIQLKIVVFFWRTSAGVLQLVPLYVHKSCSQQYWSRPLDGQSPQPCFQFTLCR